MEKFRSFSTTHKGAKHKDDVPCQDASSHIDHDTAAIAVVADGHGSARCFRSDIGSEKAVEIAKNSIAAFVDKTPKLPNLMTVQFVDRRKVEISESKTVLSNMARKIIDKWFAAVMKDEEEHPLKDDPRLDGIASKYKNSYINNVDYRCRAYGTTLMAAVMGKKYWFGFQVGDGKCVALYEDGSWRLPIPWDDKCSFNITASICDDDSLSGFRYWFGFKNSTGKYTEYGYGVNGQGKDYVREIKSRPLAVFIGSDGVDDSYPRVDSDKYIINFYRNRVVSLAESGYDAFNEEIDGLAKRFADRESTDDVSIAGIIGDVGKADTAEMKRSSEVHEAVETASVKRRDADEKKHALDAAQKRTYAGTANQRRLEIRIAAVENDIDALNTKKASFDSNFVNDKAEIETEEQNISGKAEIERNIRAKQDEINKLKGELETLKEQTGKQTDILAQIKAACERAEAEARALETTVQNNNQSREVSCG